MNIDKVGIGVVVRKNKGKCIHMYSYTSRFSGVKKAMDSSKLSMTKRSNHKINQSE